MPFKEDTCREIARIGGGVFFRATDTKTMREIFDQIDKLERTGAEVQQYQNYDDLFPWLLATGFIFLGVTFTLREAVWSVIP